jgi:hypothetical protein
MTIDAATQTILIPGSVWTRETSKGPKDVTVLFITNLGLDEAVLAKSPQQVVFLTEKMEVLSMTPERFTKNRNFSTMNPQAETLINALLAPELEDGDDDEEIDLDAIQLPEDSSGDGDVSLDDQEPATAAVGETFETTGDLLKTQAQNKPSTAPVLELKSDINAALQHLLTSRFVSYSESMSLNGTGDTLLTLRFALSPELGLDTLVNAFGIEGPIDSFTINSAIAPTVVEIDSFIQVWLETVAPMNGHPSQSYGLVQVTSFGDIRAKQDLVQTPQPAAAPAGPPSSQNDDDVPGDFVGIYKALELEGDEPDVEEVPTTTKSGVNAFILDSMPTPAAAPAPGVNDVIDLNAVPASPFSIKVTG